MKQYMKVSWKDIYMYMVELVDRMCDELGEKVDGSVDNNLISGATPCLYLRSRVEDFASSLPKCNTAWEVLQHFYNLMKWTEILYDSYVYGTFCETDVPWQKVADYTRKIVDIAVNAVVRRILELYSR